MNSQWVITFGIRKKGGGCYTRGNQKQSNFAKISILQKLTDWQTLFKPDCKWQFDKYDIDIRTVTGVNNDL